MYWVYARFNKWINPKMIPIYLIVKLIPHHAIFNHKLLTCGFYLNYAKKTY